MGTLKYINLILYIDIHLQRVKYIINEQSMNINVLFLFFSFVLLQIVCVCVRERERVYKIGYKEKQSQSHLSYLDGFLWRIFLLLRADKPFLIFNTGLKNLGHSCPRYLLFVFVYPEYLAFGSVHHEPCPKTNFSFLSISADGKESPLPS